MQLVSYSVITVVKGQSGNIINDDTCVRELEASLALLEKIIVTLIL